MINSKYVLFTRIPIVITNGGKIFCDVLWAKDLILHLGYLKNFYLCCPTVTPSEKDDISGLVEITDLDIKHIYKLNRDGGIGSVIRNFIPNFITVKKACSKADIVHSGGAGWAFPLSFYIMATRHFIQFQWIIVIESSFWMLAKGKRITFRKFFTHYLHKIILTWCVGSADARIFTQSFYRSLFLKEYDRTLIAPATWINEEWILPAEKVIERASKRKRNPVEILFPARLVEDKGVFVVFNTVNILQKLDITCKITIMGSGSLTDQCKNFSKDNHGSVQVDFSEPVDYGAPFFNLLENYDVILVANIKEEQPRIIFDAFSQGIPVIAPDTYGISDITKNKYDSIIFKTGDAKSLAQAIIEFVRNPEKILEMGLSGLGGIENKTHAQMHIERENFLKQTLNC